MIERPQTGQWEYSWILVSLREGTDNNLNFVSTEGRNAVVYRLAELGLQSWELVSVVPMSLSESRQDYDVRETETGELFWVFKRQRQK